MSLLFSLFAFIVLFFFGRHLGRNASLIVSMSFSFISLCICLYYFIKVFFYGHIIVFNLGKWIVIGNLLITYKFLLDPLSISFATLISLITLLILIYSYDYLHYDPNLVKFFSYLNFFSFSMSCLVLSGNYVVMFLGWEAVGLASYLLINFWSTRNQANQSALKAIIFNRFGDIFFIAGMGLMFFIFKSFDFEDIELLLPQFKHVTISLFSYSFSIIELLALFLFLAAAAKSAQLFLHPWLPDAMEGPTPVSALLHSATMVTAGVFLILRSSIIFTNAPSVSFLVACIGLITANISSFTGLLQYDIKRIIAFSTCSQLGFMVFATGVGNYSFALFHLINHAFFKALLFLCAGSVIHATGEQDIRRMGALFKSLPITYCAMLLASLSLVGFPFLSGFYSKDFLLEATFASFDQLAYFIYFISALSTFISSFYSFRLIYFVFFGEVALSKRVLATVSEGSLFLYFPLIVLTLFSIFSGFYLKDLMVLHSSFYFFQSSPLLDISFDFDFFNDFFKIMPSLFSLFGILAVYIVYSIAPIKATNLYQKYVVFSFLFCKKFFADAFNSYFIFRPFAAFSLNVSYKLLDKGIYELLGPHGIYTTIGNIVENSFDIETTSLIYRSLLFALFFIGFLMAAVLTNTYFVLILMLIFIRLYK